MTTEAKQKAATKLAEAIERREKAAATHWRLLGFGTHAEVVAAAKRLTLATVAVENAQKALQKIEEKEARLAKR